MKSVTINLLFILAWFLTACSNSTIILSASQTEPNESSATNQEIPTIQQTSSLIATITKTLSPSPSITRRPTNTPNLAPSLTAQAWLESANLAYSVFGKGFFLGRSDGIESWKISSEDVENDWRWSPDGMKLAYKTQSELVVLDLQTGIKMKITPKGYFDWHPGGKILAISTPEIIYLINVEDGSEIAQLKLGMSAYNQVSFSADGKQLAFMSERLYIINLMMDENGDSSGFGDYQEISTKLYDQGIRGVIRVSWSPGNDRLAIVNDNWPDLSHIAIITPQGNVISKVKITDRWEQEFSWSPDGNYLAIKSESENILPSRIYVVNNRGGGLVRIEEFNSWGECCLSWRPDSKQLVYGINQIGGYPVFIMSDPAGIQKMILPISEKLPKENSEICIKPRPGRDFKLAIEPSATPNPLCTSWSRLQVNGQAKLVDISPNRVRSTPQKGDNLISQLAPGSVVKVLEGPVCADGLVFWKVESDTIPGGVGWTAEGDGTEYWLEPYSP